MRKTLITSILIIHAIAVPAQATTISMVSIPGGEFEMGKYEVTNAQYCQYLNSAYDDGLIKVNGGVVYASSDSSNSQRYFETYGYGSGTHSQIDYSGGVFSVRTKDGHDMSNHPVVEVSWYGAMAFCDYYGYRLPTDDEWEYAARGGLSGMDYPWGNTWDNNRGNCWNSGDSYESGAYPWTTPVDYYPSQNNYGLHDMAGNVFEWTSSCYNSDCSGGYRVVRGGGWGSLPYNWHGLSFFCRVSFRMWYEPNGWDDLGGGNGFGGGFRVVLKSPSYTINLTATNNWDGKTINLSWSSGAGSVEIYRKKESGPFEYITTVSSSSYTDTVPEPGKNYTYVLKNMSGTQVSNEATVKAEVIVVLVRGYSTIKPVNPNYWKPEGHSDLNDVNDWFTQNGVTCWEPPQSGEFGQGLHGWKSIGTNADELAAFISSKRVGEYQNARINLIGHSAGGLVARDYVKKNPGYVNNIFSIQTPHTGTPLAEIVEFWPAAADYTPLEVAKFNLLHRQADLGQTELYSFWSTDYTKVFDSLWLKLGAGYIAFDSRFNSSSGLIEFPITDSGSDGAVPAVSAQGKIYLTIPTSPPLPIPGILTPVVSIDEDKLAYSGLDHFSCHRHPDTLENIMDWLDLPYTQAEGQSMSMVLAQAESDEPNIVPLYYVAGFTGEFDDTADVNEVVSIGNSDSAYFRAITSDVNCSFTLTDPCGTIYDPCYASAKPNVTYEAEDELFLYEVNSPIPGAWTLNLLTTVAPPNSVDYGLTVFESESITLSSYSNPPWGNTDANILLVAVLTENDNPLVDANIVVDVVLPDMNSSLFNLYDDGLHNDANADDGIYASIFGTTGQVGTYNYEVTANGLSSLGTNFQRSTTLSFTISSLDVNFAGDINDFGIDLNANGLYDILRFTIPIDVCEPNVYLLTASLSDSNDNLIKLLSTGSLTLSTGLNTLTLEVTAEDIVRHDVNGPYMLSDIVISDAGTGLIITVHADYNTASYSVGDFEPLDTDGDGLSDNFELSIGTDVNLLDSDHDGVTDYDEVSFDGDASSYNPATDLNPLNADTDSDGMSDGWEINFGFDPLVDDGAKDNDDDTDGLTNLQEYQNNTKPNNPDTDLDTMPDGWEVSFGLNPVFYDASQDPDVDELTNVQEYQNDTDPTDDDTDDDAILDGPDNCKLMYNPSQADTDGDGEGDTCEADISGNHEVDFLDFALMAARWLDDNCGDCDGADLDGEEDVDFADLRIFTENWLSGLL